MEVLSLYCRNSLQNMIHILVTRDRQAICVDPYDADLVNQALKAHNLQLSHIINTHEHWDHVRGVAELQRGHDCQVWAVPGVTGAQQELRGGEEISLGDLTVQTVFTPGHTMQHVCFLALEGDEPPSLFSGDMLFNAGVGNCHNGGDVDVMFDTFEAFFQSLDDRVRVYPGHDYIRNNLAFAREQEPDNAELSAMERAQDQAESENRFLVTTMGEERRFNPFLRLQSEQIRERTQTAAGERRDVFLELRARRNQW